MQKEITKILITSVVSTLIALLQAYLIHLGTPADVSAVPALAGVNGFALSVSHALSKRV